MDRTNLVRAARRMAEFAESLESWYEQQWEGGGPDSEDKSDLSKRLIRGEGKGRKKKGKEQGGEGGGEERKEEWKGRKMRREWKEGGGEWKEGKGEEGKRKEEWKGRKRAGKEISGDERRGKGRERGGMCQKLTNGEGSGAWHESVFSQNKSSLVPQVRKRHLTANQNNRTGKT